MKVALWAEIHRLYEIEGLSRRQIARHLRCSRKTVTKALARSTPPRPSREKRGSTILDPFKPKIEALIERYPALSAVRVCEEIAKGPEGYRGEVTLVRRYLRSIRPDRRRIYQEVDYPPGSAMQVDWGSCGTVEIGKTRRRVSVFVAVLCYSRMIYIEFTLSQKKEFFYRAVVHALESFDASPAHLIVDNLKAAVLEGSGRTARFHPEFLELCGTYRMKPVACERRDPQSKGVVEGGVRYVKRNALAGREEELEHWEDYAHFASYWRDQIANVRKHASTGERPIDRFEKERSSLQPLPPMGFDADEVVTTIATPHCRVLFDSNRYSLPPEYARKPVVLRADSERVRILFEGQEVAAHARCYERGQRLVRPQDREQALARRRRSQASEIEARFDALGPEAEQFRRGLAQAPLKPIVHLRRILEFVRLYGHAEVLGALIRALEYGAFDAAYVRNLIDQERRRRYLPSPLPIAPRRRELLEEIDLEEPDPGLYDELSAEEPENEEDHD